MNEAPVGFHCPGCIAEGKRTVRAIKQRTPRVTQTIIGLCVVMFGLDFVMPDLWQTLGVAGVAVFEWGEYYRLVTSLFMHAGIMHIAFNMLVLHQFGTQLEMFLGSKKFALIYFISGIAGSLASATFNDPYTISVGASGAIFGLMGSYFVVAKSVRFDTSQIVGVIGINLVIGFIVPNIDWHAHLGGLVAGAAATAVIHRLFPNWG
jgi:membrane associated rhomboid family serine protease